MNPAFETERMTEGVLAVTLATTRLSAVGSVEEPEIRIGTFPCGGEEQCRLHGSLLEEAFS